MSKSKIYEYDPIIYPRKLFVVDTLDEETLSEFCELDGKVVVPLKDCYAMTSIVVKRRSTGKYGVLVAFNPKEQIDNSTLAHEAVHAANNIFHSIGLGYTLEDDEALAYFVGWIVKCLDKTLRDIRNVKSKKDEQPNDNR